MRRFDRNKKTFCSRKFHSLLLTASVSMGMEYLMLLSDSIAQRSGMRTLLHEAAAHKFDLLVMMDKHVLSLISNLIQNTTPSHSQSSDPFWEKSETALLQALLQELGERKIALFCCIPDSDKSLNYLVGMIYTQLIQTLYRQADRVHKGRLPVPVHCLMDEYANLSLPKDTFLSALATMRSRAIFCSIIVQNMAQLKAMYKDDWESLVGLCDEFLYLGGTEKETHK